MCLFTVCGVGGAFSALTSLDASELRRRLNPWDEFEKTGILARAWAKVPTLTSQRLLYGIGGTCLVIFVGWQVPALSGFMARYFMSSLKSSAPITSLIFSTYSHQNLLHFGMNMFCFLSFFDFMRRQLSPKQLLFFCWSAGLVTGCGSALVNALVRGSVPSLGCSGMVLASLAYICTKQPDARFSLFLMGSFRGDQILPCIVLFDLCGLIFFRNASIIDHAGHLIGVAFGAFYAKFGQQLYARRVLSLTGRQP